MKQAFYIVFLCIAGFAYHCGAQNVKRSESINLSTAAGQTEIYLPLLKGKNIGLVANHTSLIGQTHLLDTLLALDVNVRKIFSPEHGFRGTADAGAHIEDGVDSRSGLPVISLYGKHRKPTKNDLQGLDLILFDLQDVGVRFYTYISTMTYAMEACAENNIPFVILDRPNPNGHYIDGPVLDTAFSSFVGLHKVPVVYGMTMGEYARMVNGEGWLQKDLVCDLKVIPLRNYVHGDLYQLRVKPSPNLPNMNSVYLYPSLCFFEGTIMSVGRGTEYPFQLFGHPDFAIGSYVFTPEPKAGASMHPKHKGERCFGISLIGYSRLAGIPEKINLAWLTGAYDYFSGRGDFFNSYFDKLAGTDKLRKQIISGASEEEIRKSWQEDLAEFKKIRNKYLIYK